MAGAERFWSTKSKAISVDARKKPSPISIARSLLPQSDPAQEVTIDPYNSIF